MADTQATTTTTTETPEVVETPKAEETPKTAEKTKEETNGSAKGDAKNGDSENEHKNGDVKNGNSENGRTNAEAKNGEEAKEEVLKMEKMAPVPVVIFYDLETTNFDKWNRHKDVQILSIGAVNGKTGDEYHKYMVPTCEINPGASRVNKIEKSGDGLTLRGVPIEAGQPKEVLEDFMDWLDRQSPEPVLVAHNNYAFDAVVLKNNLKRFGVQRQIRNSQNKDSWVWMTELRDQKKFPELDFQTCKLEQCLKIFKLRDEDDRSVLHDGLQDSKDCQLVCDRAAQKLGFQDYANYLAGNRRQE